METESLLSFDTALDQKIHRPPARILAGALSNTSITPNQVTLATLIPAVLSSGCFLMGNFAGSVWALFFFYLWAVLDHTDGELARVTGTSSKFGENLDDLCDNIASILMYGGIFFGLLPFWNAADKKTLTFFFVGGIFSNLFTYLMILAAKRRKRREALKRKQVSRPFLRFQKMMDCFTGRELFYVLIFAVLIASYRGDPFWLSFAMGFLIIGLFATSVIFAAGWAKMTFSRFAD